MENKEKICEKLTELLQLTRAGEDVQELEYLEEDGGDQFVCIRFRNGYKKLVNVTGDSGLAIMGDVARTLY